MDSLAVSTEVDFNGDYVKARIAECVELKHKKIVNELKEICNVSDDVLMRLYTSSISMHQKTNQYNGSYLENEIVAVELKLRGVRFAQQITIDKQGIIVGTNVKKGKCYHIIDFVIADNIQIGKSITNYNVISCKTTCRERWTQDDWTYTYAPLKYILLTTSSDYPSSEKFQESEQRKIITCAPKSKDDRKYKINFEHLIREVTYV